MRQLASRVAIEQMDNLEREYTQHVLTNGLANTNTDIVFGSLRSMDLIELGQIRGCWLTQMPSYIKYDPMQQPLLADLVHAIALIIDELGCRCYFSSDGICLLEKDDTLVGGLVPVSGLGHKRFAGLEGKLMGLEQAARRRVISRPVIFSLAAVQGLRNLSPPEDIAVEPDQDDIVQGAGPRPYHRDIEELRLDPGSLREVLDLA